MMKLVTLAVALAMAAATSAGAPKIYDPSAEITPLTGIFQQVPADAAGFNFASQEDFGIRSSCPVAEPTSGYKVVFSTKLGKCYVEGAAVGTKADGLVAANFKAEGQATFNGIVSKCRYSAVGHDWTATLSEVGTLRLSVDASSVGIGARAQAFAPYDNVLPSGICSWVIYDNEVDDDFDLPLSGVAGDVGSDDLTTFYFRFVTPARTIGPVKLYQTTNGSYVFEGAILQMFGSAPLYPGNLTVNHSRYFPEADNHAGFREGGPAGGNQFGSVLWTFKSYLDTFPIEGGALQGSFTVVAEQIVFKSREVSTGFFAFASMDHFRFNNQNHLLLGFSGSFIGGGYQYGAVYSKVADVADAQFQTAVIDDSFGGEKQRSNPSTDKRKRRRRNRRRRNRKKWKLNRFATTTAP